MKRLLGLVVFFVVGGSLFWGTDAALQQFGVKLQAPVRIILKTILLPTLTVGCFWLLVRIFALQAWMLSIALAMSAGIWLSGPVYLIILDTSLAKNPMGAGEMAFHLAVFPLATLLVALYNGALGGLIFTTILLPIAGLGWLGRPGGRQ